MLRIFLAVAAAAALFSGCSGSNDATETPAPANAVATTATGPTTGTAPKAGASTTTVSGSPTAGSAATATPTLAATTAPTVAPTQPAATATQAAPRPKTLTVQLGEASFNPSNITVRVGDTVDWRWGGDIPHSVTSRGGFASDPAGIKSAGSYAFTFSTPGVYQYFCQVHQASGMTGQVTVQ